MEFNNLLENTYRPIFLELESSNVFKTEKQKDKWWELVTNGLKHTFSSIADFNSSKVINGIEILADVCCDNCKKYNGIVYKDMSLAPLIPIIECQRMREGLNCNCCFLPYIE